MRLMDMTTSYLYVCILCFSTYVDSLMTITAHVGDTAILPCALSNVVKRTAKIKWQKNSQTVFMRSGKVIFQDKAYSGRVVVSDHMLLKGNCSLVLKKVQKTDAAVYDAYRSMTKKKETVDVLINSVKLKVIDKAKPAQKKMKAKWPIFGLLVKKTAKTRFLGKLMENDHYPVIIILFFLSWFFIYILCKKTLLRAL